MERWRNHVAIITGASSGIGAAILKDLALAGVNVVGVSRRPCRVTKIQLTLPAEAQSRVHSFDCDITREDNVKKVFEWVNQEFGGIDILVNCAGVAYQGMLTDPNLTGEIKDTFDVHVMGMMFCIREAFHSMKQREFAGHIVNIDSYWSHHVPRVLATSGNFLTSYVPSKFAAKAMSQVFRQEFANAKRNIKLTNISPGITCTPISNNALESIDLPVLNVHDVSNAILYCLSTPPHVQNISPGLTCTPIYNNFFVNIDLPLLNAHDVSGAILYCLGTPPHVQIQELIIKPLGEIY